MSKQHLEIPQILQQNGTSVIGSKDRLFFLERAFDDPKLSPRRYFCPHINQIEGILSSYPELRSKIEFVRVPFARPRHIIIDLLGEEYQALPVLVFGTAEPPPADAKTSENQYFIADTRRILELLAERHGIPWPH